ncbi:MAG TPA: hypothetical protein VHA76_09495 [Solirubrobacterales bacterium]|nr:hypothetical protein [Solirubrobacterales bacterium]
MNDRSSEDRLYAAVLLTFLAGLVALGLLGVPALLVAAIGAVLAAVGIALFHRAPGPGRRRRHRGRRVPDKYVPSVLEGSRVKRRRLAPLRRHRGASPPLRFR